VEIKTVPYRAAELLVKLILGCVARVHVLGAVNANRTGGPARSATAARNASDAGGVLQAGFVLAANHISHFDPFLISLAVRRKIDWMTMAEFFRFSVVGFLLRAIDAFPAERDRADRKTIRTAIERLKGGRVVGLFPEGGIRDGVHSLLEGAPLRPGAATLAHIARVPILPCIILGSDRLYSWRQWLPLRRTPIWIAFGDPISHFAELQKSEARERIESELRSAFKHLYAQLRQEFRLTADDLPHSPRERMSSRLVGTPRCGVRSAQRADPTFVSLSRSAAITVDSLICASFNLLHTRHRLNGHSREEMERYVAKCELLTAQEYYAAPDGIDPFHSASRLNGAATDVADSGVTSLRWSSPIKTQFSINNVAHADFLPCPKGISAPTVFLLHALMSTSRVGQHRCARHFNELGWNVCFVHLPYHFSRVPRGYWNGELAITCDLIRNAEGLRQGVIELRQLMSALRRRGCREIGVVATSYGGWIGALLAMVERDLRFVALMAPIVNIEHAIWASPAARRIRRQLRQADIEPSLVARHFHLSSPLHNQPLCDSARVLFVSGEFDSIAPAEQIEAIQRKWDGSELLRVRQGHFGHRMMRETIARLKERGDL
jgi:1-acyl-sn-glycerol-3-phosphate acyltransferase